MSKLRRAFWLPGLLLAVLACNLITPSVTPSPPSATPNPPLVTANAQPSPTEFFPPAPSLTPAAPAGTSAAVTETPAPAASATPASPAASAAASATPAAQLSSTGPWLLFSAEDGLWAANADGSGLTLVMKAGPFFQLGPAAPNGAHAVVMTASDSSGFHGRTLSLLSLPGGDLKKIAALTDAATEPGADAQFGDVAIDLITPLGQSAWSPDGKDLAFIGAQAGPSDDLFKYNLASGQATRLTDGPSQAYGPSWSPDGKYIVQMGAKTFGTGAGYTMDGVWAAAADNSSVKLLYKPDSGGEDVLGWPGPETFAVTSFYVACANGKPRTYNLADGKIQSIFDSYYTQIAVDPASGVALLAVNQFMAECTPGAAQGLFLARPGVAPKLLDAKSGNAGHLGWSAEAGLFYAFTDAGWLAFTPEGQPAQLPVGLNGEPLVSAGGKNWAWVDQGSGELWASVSGAAAQSVYSGTVLLPRWSPDGQNLLFIGDGRLYAAGAADLNPRPAGDPKTLTSSDVSEWVE